MIRLSLIVFLALTTPVMAKDICLSDQEQSVLSKLLEEASERWRVMAGNAGYFVNKLNAPEPPKAESKPDTSPPEPKKP